MAGVRLTATFGDLSPRGSAGFVLALILVLVGCSDEAPDRGTVNVPPRISIPTGEAASYRPDRPFRFTAAQRVVAIGDLHGDLAATRAALKLSGAIDDRLQWIGGALVVVQTGDQLDRGDEERAVLDLLDRLAREAATKGGAVHLLNGNHETMNVAGDFRYVTLRGFTAFADVDVPASDRLTRIALRLPDRMHGRAYAFLPGGRYAKRLARRNTVIIVGRSVFAHGGVLPRHVRYGLGRLNEDVRSWMAGKTLQPPRIIADVDSPVWTRRYSTDPLSAAVCAELDRVLNALDVDRMVVGHTVQKGGISSACDQRVWRIDVGMARYYEGSIAALEIDHRNNVRIIH